MTAATQCTGAWTWSPLSRWQHIIVMYRVMSTMPLQASTIPPVWGEMTVTSIGQSFMEYSVQVEMNRARQGAVLER